MTDWIEANWPAPANIVAGTTLRHSAADVIPVGGEPCWLNQVHGTRVIEAGIFDTPPEADGSIAHSGDNVCIVKTADCLPVLLCSLDGRRFGAAHAGWRGLAGGIIENTVTALDVNPAELIAWLGPAISAASYEVGDEVRDAFIQLDANADGCFLENARGRWQANLYALARQRLYSMGVNNVTGGGFCTFLDKKRFFSYRRNPDCGRMLSFVGVK